MRDQGSPQLTAALMTAEVIAGMREMEWQAGDEMVRNDMSTNLWGTIGAFRDVVLENALFYETRFFPEYIATAWFFDIPAFKHYEATMPRRLPLNDKGRVPAHEELASYWHALNRMKLHPKLKASAESVWEWRHKTPPEVREDRGHKVFTDYPGL
jgi:hypothetical protein